MCIINSQLCSSMHKYTPGSPHLLSVAVLNTMTKSHLGKERLNFSLWVCLVNQTSRSSRKNLDEETKTGVLEGHCLLASFPAGTDQLPSAPENHLSKDGTSHSRITPPPPPINQNNTLQTCPQASLVKAIP